MNIHNATITVVFSFIGPVPVPFTGNCMFEEYQSATKADWPDPGTAGNTRLREILMNSSVDTETMRGISYVTAQIAAPVEAVQLLHLLCLPHDDNADLSMMRLREVDVLLEAGLALNDALLRVEVKTARLLQSGHTVESELVAERHLYLMNENGVCFTIDADSPISVDKLVGVTFFPTSDAMDEAGVKKWGENGSENWRCTVTKVTGNISLMTEFGDFLDLGNEPEVRLSSLTLSS